MRQMFPEDRRNLLVIKQHIVERYKNPVSSGASSIAGNTPLHDKMIQAKKESPFKKLEREQATVI